MMDQLLVPLFLFAIDVLVDHVLVLLVVNNLKKAPFRILGILLKMLLIYNLNGYTL